MNKISSNAARQSLPSAEVDFPAMSAADRLLTRAWTSSAVAIAECIGVDAAARLMEAYGNSDYCYVPKRFSRRHRLFAVIGETALRRLIAAHAGIKLVVAMYGVIRAKKHLIAKAEGSTAEISKRFGVTPRWVRRVKRETTQTTAGRKVRS